MTAPMSDLPPYVVDALQHARAHPESLTPRGRRRVITLVPAVGEAVERMGKQLGDIGPTETVRRGLMLLDLFLSLGDKEELVIRNKDTRVCDRLRFTWDTFDQPAP